MELKIKLALIIVLLLAGELKAQYVDPLDNVEQEKRAQLVLFGENNFFELLAESTLKLFREAGDQLQRSAKEGYYRIPEMNSGIKDTRFLDIPISVMNSLNKKEFAAYFLVNIADSLSLADLKKLNRLYRTKEGMRIKGLMYKAIKRDSSGTYDQTGSPFNSTESYYAFLEVNRKLEYIYSHILDILYLYIDRKTKAYKLE